tara:strand:+ start:668 stop:805 length:138 start_codon:yes stop_codon:yes gene_type:complete
MSTTCRVHKKYLEKEVFKNLNRIQDYDFNKVVEALFYIFITPYLL